jgi:cell division protein FtsB
VKARGAVVATLLGVMLLSALYPLRQYASQDSHVNKLVAQVRSLDRTIAELKRNQELLLSDDEIERIAREELGMVRPGEVAFAVVGDGTPAETPGAAPNAGAAAAPVTRGGGSWYARWWHAVKSSLSGMR